MSRNRVVAEVFYEAGGKPYYYYLDLNFHLSNGRRLIERVIEEGRSVRVSGTGSAPNGAGVRIKRLFPIGEKKARGPMKAYDDEGLGQKVRIIGEVSFGEHSKKTHDYYIDLDLGNSFHEAIYDLIDPSVRKFSLAGATAVVYSPISKSNELVDLKAIRRTSFGPHSATKKIEKFSFPERLIPSSSKSMPRKAKDIGKGAPLTADRIEATPWSILSPEPKGSIGVEEKPEISVGNTPLFKLKGEDDKMKNSLINQLGKRHKGIFGMSLMGGKPAVKIQDGWVVFDKDKKTLHDVSDFVMEMDFMPGISMPVALKALKSGDLVDLGAEGLAFVLEPAKENGNQFSVLLGDGTIKSIMGKTHVLMGNEGFVVQVMNPMSGMAGSMGGDSDGGFNPMMMLAMGGLGDKDKGDGKDSMMETMMMMSMMSGGGMFKG